MIIQVGIFMHLKVPKYTWKVAFCFREKSNFIFISFSFWLNGFYFFLVKEWWRKTSSPLSNMIMASPNGEKILYLLAKFKSKDTKLRAFQNSRNEKIYVWKSSLHWHLLRPVLILNLSLLILHKLESMRFPSRHVA